MLPLLPAYLIVITIGISLACIFTLFTPSLWLWIPALTTYGKSSFLELKDQPVLLQTIAVPKKFTLLFLTLIDFRWFTHFYILGVLNMISWLVFFYLIEINAVCFLLF